LQLHLCDGLPGGEAHLFLLNDDKRILRDCVSGLNFLLLKIGSEILRLA